jgi:hypothetical protein
MRRDIANCRLSWRRNSTGQVTFRPDGKDGCNQCLWSWSSS